MSLLFFAKRKIFHENAAHLVVNYCHGRSRNKSWGKTKRQTFAHWISSIAALAMLECAITMIYGAIIICLAGRSRARILMPLMKGRPLWSFFSYYFFSNRDTGNAQFCWINHLYEYRYTHTVISVRNYYKLFVGLNSGNSNSR